MYPVCTYVYTLTYRYVNVPRTLSHSSSILLAGYDGAKIKRSRGKKLLAKN
jgi:hypothetical protein